jgi:hypothetical protein
MDSENWIPLGWIPIIDETKSRRPTQAYQGSPARNTRLFYNCWRNFISNICKQFAALRVVIYAHGIARKQCILSLELWEINMYYHLWLSLLS